MKSGVQETKSRMKVKRKRETQREIDREIEEAENDPVSKKATYFLKKNVFILPIIILCRGTICPFTWRN